MTPIVNPVEQIVTLKKGGHNTREQGMCVMEATAYVAGEPHSDTPECACPVIGAFLRSWNDAIADDETRTRLLAPLIPRLVDSKRTEAVEERRSYLALDWLIRVHTPTWLALSPSLQPHAETLRGLAEIVDLPSAKTAGDPVRAARAAAGAAAGAATWDAAWDAAWAAARAAAGTAAWDAAWDAAGAAARAAAGTAAWDAARAAAWAAAWDALKPTVAELQQSALALIDRMLAVETA